jgi:hypothetical protein
MLSANTNCKEYMTFSSSGVIFFRELHCIVMCRIRPRNTTTNEDLNNTSNNAHDVSWNKLSFTIVGMMDGMGPWTKERIILISKRVQLNSYK